MKKWRDCNDAGNVLFLDMDAGYLGVHSLYKFTELYNMCNFWMFIVPRTFKLKSNMVCEELQTVLQPLVCNWQENYANSWAVTDLKLKHKDSKSIDA